MVRFPSISTFHTGVKATAEDLLSLPADGKAYELVRGELAAMVPAGARHGRVAGRLLYLLAEHVYRHDLGAVYAAETGFQIASEPDTVRAADVAFVAQNRLPPEGEEPDGYWNLAPDLVVEVASPYDSATYLQAKVTDWLAAGVRQVWVVYPDSRTITVYFSSGQAVILREDDVLDGGDVLPGFRCRVREVFQ